MEYSNELPVKCNTTFKIWDMSELQINNGNLWKRLLQKLQEDQPYR